MKILFVCTHNRCRSILAEAIMRQNCQHDFQVRSAGSAATGAVHPQTLKNLQRRGYATDNLSSQSWDDLHDFVPDVTITVCDKAANEACPLFLDNSIKVHWGLADPTRADIAEKDRTELFDQVINTLEKRIEKINQHTFEHLSDADILNIFEQIGAIN